MTEKEQLSTTQPDHIRSSWYPPEDEISFVDLLEVIARKKILIIFTVSIFTLLSILYAQLVTPTYKAVIGFLPPDETKLTAYFPDYTADLFSSIRILTSA